ncbi:MAG: amidase [Chloroflexi bacterium]|nr:amidase [Chloroflexota bacterium]
MRGEELAFTPAWQLREMVANKKVSPVELTELYLRRIEALNPKLNAYLTVCGDEATASAREAERAVARGDKLGLLHGLPISVKDLMSTKGIRTTFGSLVYKDFVPQQDDLIVERVRRAGAIIVGKTNTPEFGALGTCENRLADGRNPWDPSRTCGGSSGGASAAAAAGLAALHLGSDGGGSIRIPASFCGVFGIKPNADRVPTYPNSPGLARFGQAGPISRTVRDAAMLLQVLAGPDSRDPVCLRDEPPDFSAGLGKGVRGLRVAWSADLGYAAVDPEVLEVCSKAARVFAELGAKVEEADLALEDPWLLTHRPIGRSDTYAQRGQLLDEHPFELTTYILLFLAQGKAMTGAQYSMALRRLVQLRAQVERFMERYDLLLTPTLSVPAFPIGQFPSIIGGRSIAEPILGFFPFSYPFNHTGQPAATVPCGFSHDGLPIGLQIVGRWKDEVTVLRAAAAFEEARPWAECRPPVS